MTGQELTVQQPSHIQAPRCEAEVVEVTQPSALLPVRDDAWEKNMPQEFLAALKDDRASTKKAIAASIDSAEYVFEQNEQAMDIYGRELRRSNLSAQERVRLVELIENARKSTEDTRKDAQEFQREQLAHSHKMVRGIVVVTALALVLRYGKPILRHLV